MGVLDKIGEGIVIVIGVIMGILSVLSILAVVFLSYYLAIRYGYKYFNTGDKYNLIYFIPSAIISAGFTIGAIAWGILNYKEMNKSSGFY